MKNLKNLIIGGGRGIGRAIALKLREHGEFVLTTSRSPLPDGRDHATLDPLNEDALAGFAARIDRDLDRLIVCTGFLSTTTQQPEKRLADISLENLVESFKVNTCIFALVAKHFKEHLTESAVLAALSARVGSIEDNKLGGWHAYRSSKAALNMMIRNVAIELSARKSRPVKVLALHPGTVETDLSRPFLARVQHEILSTEQAAINLIKVMNESPFEPAGAFYSYRGERLPW